MLEVTAEFFKGRFFFLFVRKITYTRPLELCKYEKQILLCDKAVQDKVAKLFLNYFA